MKDRGEAAAARAAEVRAVIASALHAERLLLDDREYDHLAAGSRAHGAALRGSALRATPATRLDEAVRALGLPEAALPRMLGLGFTQASALAALAGATGEGQAEASLLGAIFNLGIALFDCIFDRHPARAALLVDRLGAATLDGQLAGVAAPLRAANDPAVDVLLALIVEFFVRAGRLEGGGPATRVEFDRVIRAMYRGERFATTARRDRVPPRLDVFRALRRKSALPLWTMALLGRLAGPRDEAPLDGLRTTVTLAGDVLWIIDDLADLREDLAAGVWSRPLWVLARAAGTNAIEGAAADVIGRLLSSGLVAAEARQMAARMARLQRVTGGEGLLGELRVAVQSWVYAMPG